MAKCPTCKHDVSTPFFFNLDGWRHLTCTQCKARLEMKAPRSFLLAPLMAPLFVLARQGHAFEDLAFVYSAGTVLLVLWESFHPKVRLRQRPRPQPEIQLNINRPSN
jgi:hypothetical protein